MSFRPTVEIFHRSLVSIRDDGRRPVTWRLCAFAGDNQRLTRARSAPYENLRELLRKYQRGNNLRGEDAAWVRHTRESGYPG